MRRTPARLCAVVAAALLLVCETTAPAAAHTSLTGATPAAGSTTAGPPGQVVLRYTDPVRFTQVVVLDTAGRHYESGRPSVVDGSVTAKVMPLPDGPFTVEWRVVAPDGHPVEGTYRFSVTGSAAAPPPVTRVPARPAAATGDRADGTGSGTVLAGFLALVAIVVIAAAAGAVRLRRGRT